jgi:glycosyltransferase involved in cell wall biosynthesis
MSPLISVLMTVFNGGHHLVASLDSILSQTFRDFEFLIVDDASTDGSVHVLENFAARDSRVRLILNSENKGQTACLNQGLREAKGKWIARQDADDISLPERLSSLWEVVKATPNLVLVGSNGWIIDEHGKAKGLIHVPLLDAGIRWSMPFRNPFIHTSVLFRPGSMLYDEHFKICQDWEFWSRLAERGRFTNLSSRLVAYRYCEKSLSHASSERTSSESQEIVNRIWKHRYGSDPEKPALLEEFRTGLKPQTRGSFWDFYESLRLRSSLGDTSQAAAVHHMQVAGAVASVNRTACCFELINAFRESPKWTLCTLCERFFKRGF